MKCLSLFSGVGGFDIACQRKGIEIVGACEIDKYARKVYETRFPGVKVWEDATKINPKELPDFDLLCAGFPCFPKGYKVITNNGNKKIENIKIGDKVLTHNGNFKPVINTMNREYNDCLMSVSFPYGLKQIKCTYEHPFYIKKTKKSKPMWINADKLKSGYWACIPLPKEKIKPNFSYKFGINQNKSITKTLPINNTDFWWCVGHYLAEGWYEVRRKRNGIWRKSPKVLTCCNKKETTYVYKRFKRVFNSVTIANEPTVDKLHITHRGFREFVETLGKGAKNKHLPKYFPKLPNNLLRALLNGYFYGDGTTYKGYKSITTISEQLAKDIQLAITYSYKQIPLLKKQITPNTYIIQGRTVNQNDYYTVRFKPTKTRYNFYDNNKIWVKIKIEKENRTKTKVYNIEVRDDNSYTIEGIAVHNCQDFSIAGKRLGLDGTRGTLFFEIARIAKEKRPRYLLLENVKGLLNHKGGETIRTILKTLDEVGYDAEWNVINSKYKVPQNRERIFIIGHLRGTPWKPVFPIGEISKVNNGTRSKIQEKPKSTLVYLSQKNANMTKRVQQRDDTWCLTNNCSDFAIVENEPKLKPLNDARQGYRVYDTNGIGQCLNSEAGGFGAKMGLILDETPRSVVNDKKGLREVKQATCLDANYYKGHDYHGARTLIAWSKSTRDWGTESRIKKNEANTLNTGEGCRTQSSANYVITEESKIRKLTPLECERLQGFPDYFSLVQIGVSKDGKKKYTSDTQRYKMMGNAVTVPVIEDILDALEQSVVE